MLSWCTSRLETWCHEVTFLDSLSFIHSFIISAFLEPNQWEWNNEWQWQWGLGWWYFCIVYQNESYFNVVLWFRDCPMSQWRHCGCCSCVRSNVMTIAAPGFVCRCLTVCSFVNKTVIRFTCWWYWSGLADNRCYGISIIICICIIMQEKNDSGVSIMWLWSW